MEKLREAQSWVPFFGVAVPFRTKVHQSFSHLPSAPRASPPRPGAAATASRRRARYRGASSTCQLRRSTRLQLQRPPHHRAVRDGDDDALPNAATGCEAQAMEEHAAEDIKHIPPTTVRLLPPDLCPSASLTGAMPRSGEASRAAEKAARGADRAAAEARAASARAGSGGGHRTGDVRSSRHIVGWPLVLEDGA